jgi:hypothetical protein
MTAYEGNSFSVKFNQSGARTPTAKTLNAAASRQRA